MGIWNNSADWVTTNYLLTTMSRLVSSFMLLSLMVMVVVVNTEPEPGDPNTECPDCYVWDESHGGGCRFVESNQCRLKREALDAPMAPKTKRGSSSSSSSSSRRISSSRKSSSSSSSSSRTISSSRKSSSSSSRRSSSGRK